MLGALLRAVAFVLWTAWPGYASFAAGFLLWGTCSALKSGSVQALVYDELVAAGAPERYLRITGRAETAALVSMLGAIALAAPAYRIGGYALVGAASIAMCLVNTAVGWALPERRHSRQAEVPGVVAYLDQLRTGLAEVRRRPLVRRAVLLYAVLGSLGAAEEYVSLWARDGGASNATVALLMVLPAGAMAIASWLAGRWGGLATGRFTRCLVVGAVLLAAGAGSGHPAGMVAIAGYSGLWALTELISMARLQETIEAAARATVLSVAGLGAEVGGLLILGGWALGSLWWGSAMLLALVAVPTALGGLLARRWLPPPHLSSIKE